jgi:putative hemolysin
MPVEILIILLLLVANGIFAMSEIAVVTARRVRLQQRAEEGDRRAASALKLKDDSTRFLSTVQVGITLVGLFAGAYSGATLAEKLAVWLSQWPWLASYAEVVALVIVVSVMTYFSLIIGELVPKAVALHNPERVAGLVAAPVAAVARLATPLVRLLTASTNLVLTILRLRHAPEHAVTEEEIRALIKQAALTGDVAPVEREIVEQVFRLGDRRVSGIMTPRHDIDWIDVHAGVDGLRQHLAADRHPRLLVCDGSLDTVLGQVHVEELLLPVLAGDTIDLRKLLEPPLFVPATMSVFKLLETFKTSRVHIAVVLDEFGAVEGLVTPTDILEGLVGDMPDEAHAEPGPITKREDGSWLVDGTLPIEDLEREIPLPPIPESEAGAYQTTAGLVMTRLGRVPHAGDHFTWGPLRIEVVDMDGRRVDKVLIAPRGDA